MLIPSVYKKRSKRNSVITVNFFRIIRRGRNLIDLSILSIAYSNRYVAITLSLCISIFVSLSLSFTCPHAPTENKITAVWVTVSILTWVLMIPMLFWNPYTYWFVYGIIYLSIYLSIYLLAFFYSVSLTANSYIPVYLSSSITSCSFRVFQILFSINISFFLCTQGFWKDLNQPMFLDS